MNSVKGQLEFIAVLAFIIIAVVIVIVVSRQNALIDINDTMGTDELSKPVIDSIKNLIKEVGEEELRKIYSQGGYLSETGDTVDYGSLEVGVWQECERVSIPDVEGLLSENIENEIKKILKPETDFFGKMVYLDMDKIDIHTDILSDSVKVTVNVKTTMEGSKIGETYSASIPSQLYQILEFSRNFAEKNSKNRFFEENTLDVIMRSNPESENWLPLMGLSVGCNNPVYYGGSHGLSSLEKVFEYTASHSVCGKDVSGYSENPFYEIELSDFDGDLEVSFIYPDGWDVEGNSLISNGFSPPSQLTSFSGVCLSNYEVSYSFRYPVIVLIKDTLMDDLFKFALMVNVRDNEPNSDCLYDFVSGEEDRCSGRKDCYAEIRVADKANKPVEGALVTFDDCPAGRTNDFGMIREWLPCIFSELRVYKEEYSVYGEFIGASELREYEVTLRQKTDTELHLYGVPVKRVTGDPDKKFEVVEQPKPLKDVLSNYTVLANFRKIDPGILDKEFFVFGTENDIIKIEDIGIGVINLFFAVDANGFEVGYSNVTYLSEGDEDVLYVYIPVLIEGYAVYPSEIAHMKETAENCGINHVSEGVQSIFVPCG